MVARTDKKKIDNFVPDESDLPIQLDIHIAEREPDIMGQ